MLGLSSCQTPHKSLGDYVLGNFVQLGIRPSVMTLADDSGPWQPLCNFCHTQAPWQTFQGCLEHLRGPFPLYCSNEDGSWDSLELGKW